MRGKTLLSNIIIHLSLFFSGVLAQESRIDAYPHLYDAIPQLRGRMMGVTAGDKGAWIGTRPGGAPTNKLLYKLVEGQWLPVEDFPVTAARADALNLDPDGHVWVCTYTPNTSLAEDPRLNHYDGQSWHSYPIEPGLWPTALSMVSQTEGWIAGNYGELARYKNGQWRKDVIRPNEVDRYKLFLSDIKMLDANHGWCVGFSGAVLQYETDQWRRIAVPKSLENKRLWGCAPTQNGDLWIVGDGGLIARYDGANWRVQTMPDHQDFRKIYMSGTGDGWAVGHNAIFRRQSGQWNPVPIPVSDFQTTLTSISMTSPNSGWIAGGGFILKLGSQKPLPLRPILATETHPMLRRGAQKCAALDMDGDRDIDLITIASGSYRIFENRGKAGFLEAPLISQHIANIQAFACGDIDGDNLPDLYVFDRETGAQQLYLNPGNGRFSAPFKLLTGSPSPEKDTAVFIDANEDGLMDLFSGNASNGQNAQQNNDLFTYLAGRFMPTPLGVHSHNIASGLWADYNEDGHADLILCNGRNMDLYENDGGGIFQKAALFDLYTESRQMLAADLDVDGDMDLILTGTEVQVYLNDGQANFQRSDLFGAISNNALSMEDISGVCNLADIDHNGFPDLLYQTVVGGEPVLKLYIHQGDGQYNQHNLLSGDIARSAAFFDWDGDGDLDLFLGADEKSYLFENTTNDHRFLKVALEGIRANRMAIGASVSVYEAGRLGDPSFLVGYGQLGMGDAPWGVQNLQELHFGLGETEAVDVSAQFPGGREVVRKNVGRGSAIIIPEYSGPLRGFFLLKRAITASWERSFKILELSKLGLILLLLALSKFFAAKFQTRRFMQSKAAQALLVLLYLTVAGLNSGARGLIHLYQIVGFAMILGAIAYCDRWLALWRQNHYLGHYRLLDCMGVGGMGLVYKARNVVTRQTVALKTLHPEIIEDENNRMRFFREAAILKQLNHPHIVKIFESGEADGKGYISMELLKGENLKRVISKSGPLSVDAAIPIILEILEALAYIHQQRILHRDLKTENIFIVEEKSGSLKGAARPMVKLLDFGLSRDHRMKTMTRVRELIGTLAYMAPEQFRGEAGDHRSDLYSLGVVMYEILTGSFPFNSSNDLRLMEKIRSGDMTPIQEAAPHLNPQLHAYVDKAMAPQVEDRFQTARDMANGLVRIQQNLEVKQHTQKQPSEKARCPEQAVSEDPSLKTLTAEWRSHFKTAKDLMAENEILQAQTLLLKCMNIVESIVVDMDDNSWEKYCSLYEIEELQALLDSLANSK